jgi:hypothetical protein
MDHLILSFSGAMIICVIFAGLSTRLAQADPHQFDALMGFPAIAAECSEQRHSACPIPSRPDAIPVVGGAHWSPRIAWPAWSPEADGPI